jgi:hypothetical protein
MGEELEQADWRFCNKCYSLFFDGSCNKGMCPAGNGHVSAGFNFILSHDNSQPGQADWQFCQKCQSLFFNGYPGKGVCPNGGSHQAAGFIFYLVHDNPAPGAYEQAAWRFCHKCYVLFFDGHPAKGICNAGGGHEAMGFNFVLKFRRTNNTQGIDFAYLPSAATPFDANAEARFAERALIAIEYEANRD